jgi:replicative DNA helicase
MNDEILFNGNDSANKESLEFNEAYLLSVIMRSPVACTDVVSQLEPIDFSVEAHQIIFSAISGLVQENKDVALVTLIDKLKVEKNISKVGGATYLTELSNMSMSDEGYENFVALVFKYSLYRRLDRTMKNIEHLKKTTSLSGEELILKAQEDILNIKTDLLKSNLVNIKEIVEHVVQQTFSRAENVNTLTGIDTGFSEVDSITSGWQKGDFIILAARPSMGKTALALNLATNAAARGNKVAIFSLEMPSEQLVQRILATYLAIDAKKIRTGQGLTDEQNTLLKQRSEEVGNLPIEIDDTPGLNILQLQNKLRKLKRERGVDICFIDYLQLISSQNTRSDNRQNEVSAISRQIKRIARELEMPIICLSQLSRNVEQREDKRPLMSDLRDSGAIEQDADIIMFLYRAEYYTKSAEDDSKAELIFAKHRNGSIGTVELSFSKDFGEFADKQKY